MSGLLEKAVVLNVRMNALSASNLSNIKVIYENDGSQALYELDGTPDEVSEHIEFMVNEALRERADIGGGGLNRSRTVGVATARIHVKVGVGWGRIREIADEIMDNFFAVNLSGVRRKTEPYFVKVGRIGSRWAGDVHIPFYYDTTPS